MLLLCYGDSNTWGYDPRLSSDLSCRLPKNERWTGILDEMPEFTVINEGLNGRRVPAVSYTRRSLASVLAKNAGADVLLIMLGSNDLLWDPESSAEDVADSFRELYRDVPELSHFRSPAPAERPADAAGGSSASGRPWTLLLAPPEIFLPEMPYLSGQSLLLPDVLKDLASELGVSFLDPRIGRADLAFDGLHIAPSGHRRMAGILAEYLLKNR